MASCGYHKLLCSVRKTQTQSSGLYLDTEMQSKSLTLHVCAYILLLPSLTLSLSLSLSLSHTHTHTLTHTHTPPPPPPPTTHTHSLKRTCTRTYTRTYHTFHTLSLSQTLSPSSSLFFPPTCTLPSLLSSYALSQFSLTFAPSCTLPSLLHSLSSSQAPSPMWPLPPFFKCSLPLQSLFHHHMHLPSPLFRHAQYPHCYTLLSPYTPSLFSLSLPPSDVHTKLIVIHPAGDICWKLALSACMHPTHSSTFSHY